jgi:hypothetical protein
MTTLSLTSFVDSIAVEMKERNPNSAKSLGMRTIEAHNPAWGPSNFKTPEPITNSVTTSPEHDSTVGAAHMAGSHNAASSGVRPG